jgi:teichuronic acid biosynthesis glycosyltransferase TuaC
MADTSFNDKNLLIITNGYPCKEWDTNITFVKAQVDELKQYFNNIVVIVQNPYFPKFLSKLHFLPQLFRNYSKTKDYSYDNVTVFYPRYFTFPEGIFDRFRGDSCYRSVVRCIEKNNINFDLIHAHFSWPSGYVAVKLKERYQKNVLLHIRENKGWLDRQLSENPKRTHDIWSRSDCLIRVNKRDVSLLKKYNPRVFTVYNGVDTKQFKVIDKKTDLKKQFSFPVDKKIILNVGNLRNWHKNQLTLLKALVILKEKRNDFYTVFIGEGEDKKTFESFIHQQDLEKFCCLYGTIPNEKMPLVMNASDVFAFPSFYEGNPNVFFEAQSCGLPYVGTTVGDIKDILDSEKKGYILQDATDAEELAELLNKTLDQAWDKNFISNEMKRFDRKNTIKQLLKVYQKYLKE